MDRVTFKQDLGQQYVRVKQFTLFPLLFSLCVALCNNHFIQVIMQLPWLQLVCFYYVLTTFTTVGYGNTFIGLLLVCIN